METLTYKDTRTIFDQSAKPKPGSVSSSFHLYRNPSVRFCSTSHRLFGKPCSKPASICGAIESLSTVNGPTRKPVKYALLR
ncbi:hypothetical protein DEO72_LG3g772 [Vigna unguiculata]|uniref:Uncharacterized protein n=1 Tax=Vigna unguiculata TaxID=3917 RepID=A0A4D6LCF0_VIGUN|nr:hypothetical protein DEO72_LG3g772 [Vigna unguiculata]